MSDQEMTKNSIICLQQKPSQSFLIYRIQSKNIFTEKELFKEKWEWRTEQKKWKEGFFTALATAIKKEPIISIRKYANKLKVLEKTVRTAINQDLSPDLKSLDYATWGFLENKTNATFHRNIGSLKTAIGEEWNKTSEEFILKAWKSFRRRMME